MTLRAVALRGLGAGGWRLEVRVSRLSASSLRGLGAGQRLGVGVFGSEATVPRGFFSRRRSEVVREQDDGSSVVPQPPASSLRPASGFAS